LTTNGNSELRFGFAGHETFPFRYGWLKKAVDAVNRVPEIFAADHAIVDLGVGKNMVQSIRHWGLATQILCTREDRSLAVTPIGRSLLEKWDPYLEDPASLWLIHWLLVTNSGRAGAWYIAFTRYPRPDLTKRQLSDFMVEFAERHELKVKSSTVSRDVDCFIRTYSPPASGKLILEDSFSCPLTELGLLHPLRDGESYQFSIGPKSTLPPEIVGYALFRFMATARHPRKIIALSDCLYGSESPGKVFKLDENSLIESIEALQSITAGALELDDTAGLKQIYCRKEVDATSLLRRYYSRGSGRK
jgi:hypothetical protein